MPITVPQAASCSLGLKPRPQGVILAESDVVGVIAGAGGVDERPRQREHMRARCELTRLEVS